MKIILFSIFLILPSLLLAQKNISSEIIKNEDIGPQAIWSPGMSMMQAIRDSCSKNNYPDFGKCFVEEMGKFGASAQAIEFAKLTDNQGYMRDFKEAGKVDIAYAEFPFRANENQVCFLVNGSPNMIDIDKYELMPVEELKENTAYQEILSNYPKVSIWPGDRNGTGYPVINSVANDGQEFIFNYRLQDGCHACKVVGFVNLGFDFNKEGKFLGIKIINVLETHESVKEIVSIDGIKKNSSRIIIKEGKDFKLILESNKTTGYEWQIGSAIQNKVVKFIGKEYLPGRPGLLGSAGSEVWSFKAVGKGQADIVFNYLRPWEKNQPPAKTALFHILVR